MTMTSILPHKYRASGVHPACRPVDRAAMKSFRNQFRRAQIWTLLLCLFHADAPQAVDINQYPALEALVNQMVAEDEYPVSELKAVLSLARIDQKTLDLMDRQYESLPWHKYRKIFINQNRINAGVEFWRAHETVLNRAYDIYGVPPAVIVALLGIETHYGARMGNRRVLDSLVTLSAAYPRRSKFFSAELRTFLNITRKENIAPASVLGSFAGAIGIPQFMPSSYQAYSVDFNNNDQRDLVNEMEDAIGSVANYLKVHGWNRNQRIYASVTDSLRESATHLVGRNARLVHTGRELIQAGVKFDSEGGSDRVALLSLKEQWRDRFIVGFTNFYAITRYNPSVNYAMAVAELSESVLKARSS